MAPPPSANAASNSAGAARDPPLLLIQKVLFPRWLTLGANHDSLGVAHPCRRKILNISHY
jgi:hypothetical protein